METIGDQVKNFTAHVEEYIRTREQLTKLTVAEKSSEIAGELFSAIVLVIIFSMVFIFISFAGAYYIAEVTGKTYMGFISVTGFYLLIGIILAMNKNRWLKEPVMNSIIKNIFKDKDDSNS